MIKKRKVTLRITQSMMIDIDLLCSQYDISSSEFVLKSIKQFKNEMADFVSNIKINKSAGKYRCDLLIKKTYYIPDDCEYSSCELRSVIAWSIKKHKSINAVYAY